MSPDRYLPFSGTLFLFISVANLLDIEPGYRTPTSSLSTTAALAICVFFAVPIYGIAQRGVIGYLRHYAEPSIPTMPFHIIGEFCYNSPGCQAVREHDERIHVHCHPLTIAPLFLPVLLELLGLLIGPGAGLYICGSGYRLHCFGQFE